MQWVDRFQFFLFDFDGLLVNTEHLHYQAYVHMLARHGCALSWDFAQFCSYAHLHSEALRQQIYLEFPSLDLDWKKLYEEKKAVYQGLLELGKIELMPGVEPLLKILDQKGIRHCVVTNSFRSQVDLIRTHQKALQSIPHWITREDYENPKPSPDGYLHAIKLYGQPGDRTIGFEDSLRGIQSLQKTEALPVLVCPSHHPLLPAALSQGVLHFNSLDRVSVV